uniref:FLYWCH-type domain-containing protein n=1 Tax=Strongyloides venezuelensis TaxID=75913 RepID=A0A0K0FEF5_STRVS
MTINLKKDIEKYIEREDFLTESDNQLERILYGDDIDTNKYINFNKNGTITVKALNNFENTTINYNGRQLSIRIIAISGDNKFLQLLHGYELNWRNMDTNNCRCCFVDELNININKLKNKWSHHANILFKSTYAIFDEIYKQFTKLHNVLHTKYMLDYFNIQVFHFSTIRFESANSRTKRMLLLLKISHNIAKTTISKAIFSSYLKNYKDNEEENYINDNRNWVYKINKTECFDITLNKSDIENSFIDNVIKTIEESFSFQNSTIDETDDDETYQGETNDFDSK